MSNIHSPPRQEATTRPLPPMTRPGDFNNDDLVSSSPSGKTVLIALACVMVPIVFVLLFHSFLGF